jgi:hypothetical protein
VKRSLGLLLIVAGIAAAVIWHEWLHHWVFVILGSRNEAGAWYGFWSGFGGSVPDISIIAGALVWYLNHTCHDHPGCLRWGKYPAAGGLFRLCHVHHPDLQGKRPHRELIHRLHREHAERQQPSAPKP